MRVIPVFGVLSLSLFGAFCLALQPGGVLESHGGAVESHELPSEVEKALVDAIPLPVSRQQEDSLFAQFGGVTPEIMRRWPTSRIGYPPPSAQDPYGSVAVSTSELAPGPRFIVKTDFVTLSEYEIIVQADLTAPDETSEPDQPENQTDGAERAAVLNGSRWKLLVA